MVSSLFRGECELGAVEPEDFIPVFCDITLTPAELSKRISIVVIYDGDGQMHHAVYVQVIPRTRKL